MSLLIHSIVAHSNPTLDPTHPHSLFCHESCRRTGAQFSRQNFGMVKNVL